MKQNLDIPLQRIDKNKIMEIKKASKRSYLEQLQGIFNYYEK
ncbi:spindle assembly checkpoint component MAD1, partial [Bacillus cereus]|nr:spindle assembly checkpoint component MAD1 [Bacillus cereus]